MSNNDRQLSARSISPQDIPVIDTIAQALSGLRYGSLEIIVHDGRVTQIEKREKVRLSQDPEKSR